MIYTNIGPFNWIYMCKEHISSLIRDATRLSYRTCLPEAEKVHIPGKSSIFEIPQLYCSIPTLATKSNTNNQLKGPNIPQLLHKHEGVVSSPKNVSISNGRIRSNTHYPMSRTVNPIARKQSTKPIHISTYKDN